MIAQNNMVNDGEAGSNNGGRYATLGPLLQLFDQNGISALSQVVAIWNGKMHFSLDEEEDAGEHQQEGEQEDCDCDDSKPGR